LKSPKLTKTSVNQSYKVLYCICVTVLLYVSLTDFYFLSGLSFLEVGTAWNKTSFHD